MQGEVQWVRVWVRVMLALANSTNNITIETFMLWNFFECWGTLFNEHYEILIQIIVQIYVEIGLKCPLETSILWNVFYILSSHAMMK